MRTDPSDVVPLVVWFFHEAAFAFQEGPPCHGPVVEVVEEEDLGCSILDRFRPRTVDFVENQLLEPRQCRVLLHFRREAEDRDNFVVLGNEVVELGE